MNTLGIKIKPDYKKVIGRNYYSDDYLLNFNQITGHWRICLFGKEVIDDRHPDFSALSNCFEWLPYKVVDTIETDDRAEQHDEQFANLSELYASGINLEPYKQEIEAELLILCETAGYYAAFQEEELPPEPLTYEQMF